MIGLLNNDEAIKVLENLIGAEKNRIHQIYNLGYKEGYRDAVEETSIRMSKYVNTMLERKGE